MHRRTLMACALLAGFTAFALPRAATSQDGWVTVIDGTKVGDWDLVGEANWRVEDGAVVADKKTGKDPAYLVTKTPYKDFMIRAEFWASDDANSGIFLRCQDPKKIAAASCYEVNIFDQRKDPTYGTGAIVDFAKVDPMPKAGGKWNTFEITAKGDQLKVVMNGQTTADIKNDKFGTGPFALQYGDGVIKFRKVQVKPL
jgi:hypothetical protein